MTERSTRKKRPAISLKQEAYGDHTVFRKDGRIAGMVSQIVNHPGVITPELWAVNIHTADDGLWSLGRFETRGDAIETGVEGLERNWTFDQWKQEAEKSK